MFFNSVLFLCSIIVLTDTIVAFGRRYKARIPILMADQFEPDLTQSFAADNEWNCKFEQDYCGFTNTYSMAPFRRHTGSPVFGERSLVYINVTNFAEYPAGRLESDYFAANGQPYACLSIRYLMYGTGALKMFVIQQDIQNKCLFADFNEIVDTTGQWRAAQLTINLSDGNPRFFIEAHIDGRFPRYGTAAISTVSYVYGSCAFDDTNNCQRKDLEPIPPVPSPVK